MTLAELNPIVYEEICNNLDSGSQSNAAHLLSDEERAVVVAKLAVTQVSRVCDCGDATCKTYFFNKAPADYLASVRTVRFHVRGELLIDVDSDLNLYVIERLYDENDDGAPRTVYGLNDDGTGYSVEL